MRETKFRGQCKITGTFIIGDLIHGVGFKKGKAFILPIKDNLAYMPNCDPLDGVEVIPDTIGQLTGPKDKNGIEIYEGDIITCDIAEGLGEPRLNDRKEVVSIGLYGNSITVFHTNIKVIGNIHEHPELL